MFEPARSLLIVSGVLVAAAVLSLLFSRKNAARKGIGVIIVLVLVGILLFRYRIAELTVDDNGIAADTHGRPTIGWSDVEQAIYVENLSASRYAARPTIKSSFRVIGYARARYGRFDTAGGEPAICAVESYDGEAVIVMTSDAAYVFAPNDVRGLARAIAA